MNNKVLKPNKLNLQSKQEIRSSSSTCLNRSSMPSPIRTQKSSSSLPSPVKFHQKPLILQRSPQKMFPFSRPNSADTIVSFSDSNSSNLAASKSATSTSTTNQLISSTFSQRNLADSTVTTGMLQSTSSQNLFATNSSSTVQKMRFKTPVYKSRAKQTKPKTLSHVYRPSSAMMTSCAETLNVLGASTGSLCFSLVVHTKIIASAQ